MGSDSIAISRDLVDAGASQELADAIAQKIVTHSDETAASKADIARLEGKINTLDAKFDAKFNMLLGVCVAILAGVALLALNAFLAGG